MTQPQRLRVVRRAWPCHDGRAADRSRAQRAPVRHHRRAQVVKRLVLHDEPVEQRLGVADRHPGRQREWLALRHCQAEELVCAQVHRRAHRDGPDVAVERLAGRAVACARKHIKESQNRVMVRALSLAGLPTVSASLHVCLCPFTSASPCESGLFAPAVRVACCRSRRARQEACFV